MPNVNEATQAEYKENLLSLLALQQTRHSADLEIMRLTVLSSLIAIVVSFGAAQDTSLSAVKAAFDAASIPGNLHITFKPNIILDVTFPQTTGKDVHVKAGVQLPRNATVGPPIFSVRGGAPGEVFVVATVDPDAPTPQQPTVAQIRHFLGGNFVEGFSVPIIQASRPLVNLTAPVSHWQQPTPPAGSDAHRYVFLLFHQPPGFNNQKLINSTTSIANFNISSFAEATHLGNPVGGTFIRVAPDPST